MGTVTRGSPPRRATSPTGSCASLLLLSLLATAVPASEQPPGGYERQDALGLEVRVPLAPTWIATRDGRHALYELHVSNLRPHALLLERIEVVDAASGKVLQALDGERLRGSVERRGLRVAEGEEVVWRGGQHGVIYMELVANEPGQATSSVVHRLYVSLVADDVDATKPRRLWMMETLPVRFDGVPRVLGPPLRGEGWMAGNGLANDSEHRRALIPINGRAGIAQRYAIDWVKVGPNGLLTHGDRKLNSSYYGYGEPVLAVADGRIAVVRDGIAENVPFSEQPAVQITLDTAAGNHVMLETEGQYVLYAHLRPGSIRVKPGDQVRRGDVIAEVGNSGQSDAPHLHFHLSDTPVSLAGEGLPFVFDAYDYRGNVANLDAWLESGEALHDLQPPGDRRTGEMPLSGDVVDFPRMH